MTDYKTTLQKLNTNLNTLQQREAKFAGNAPLELLNQINDHQQAIDLTRQALTGELTEAVWREALQPLNIDHTLIEGGFFQKILKALAGRLRQAILKKAFARELVPQSPDDEPASVLLKRIRGEREGQQKLPGV